MADIQLQCLGCSKSFLVSDDQAGQLVSCPRCNRKIAVPAPSENQEHAPKLTLRRETTVAGGSLCPSCGATMPSGAVICVQCGYDVRKGVRIGETTGWPPYVRWLLAGAGVLIVVMLVRVFVRPRPISEIVAPPAVQAPAPAPAAAVTAPAEALPAVTPVPVAASESPAPAQTNAPATEPQVSEEDLAQLEADYRVSLKARLDQQQPMYKPGDAVELRKLNGLVIRGKLQALNAEQAVVLREEGAATVALAELDRESRVRCDQDFRDKFIEFLVKKNVHSIRQPASP